MVLQDDVDALAKKIREGFAKHGCHILYKNDLETFFSEEPRTEENMRLLVEKFAADYRFKVQLSVKQMTALFRDGKPSVKVRGDFTTKVAKAAMRGDELPT